MIWQRICALREPAALPGDGRSITRRMRTRRHRLRSRVGHRPPLVIREPESSWWETQEELDAPVPPSGGPTMTVAVLHEQEGRTDAVVARLAELATADELVVILGSASAGESGYHAVIAGLRGRLPRHHVVAVHVPERGAQMDRHAASLERFLDAGSLPVAVTAPTSVPDVTARISSYVRADRVLRVFGTTTGADLYQVWRRQPEPSVN